MMHGHRQIARDLIEIMYVELALVLHLGVVEEESLDPRVRRGLLRLCLELIDNAGNRDEFDLIGISDQNLVQQSIAGCVVVAIDETGYDRHAFGIDGPGLFADVTANLGIAAERDESAASDRERRSRRHYRIERVYPGIQHHQVRFATLSQNRPRGVWPYAGACSEAGTAPADDPPATVLPLAHC